MKGRNVPARPDAVGCRHWWTVTELGAYGCVQCGAVVVEVWASSGLRLEVFAPVMLLPAEVQRAACEVMEMLVGGPCTHVLPRRCRRAPARAA